MPTSAGDTFKILSIDGGGIRGLYSAELLAYFEEECGIRLVDHFDMICGTSTGGLIALGLAFGISAREIAQFYCTNGQKIFPTRFQRFRQLLQIIGRGKYGNKALKKALTEVLGDKRMGDAECLLCIPSYSLTNARPVIFKFDHPEGKLLRDNDTLAVDIALATSAAPTYFPMVKVGTGDDHFVDGGVAANNPALVGLLEAIRYFVGSDKRYQHARMLSIETLSPKAGRLLDDGKSNGALYWREELIGLFSEGQAKITNFAMEQLCRSGFIPCEYVRIPGPELSATQSKVLTLDNAGKVALDLLKAKGHSQASIYAIKPEIVSFFDKRKTYVPKRGK